jgi:hypothetical protein
MTTDQKCTGCYGLGWIGDNNAGAPECECPDCDGTGVAKHIPSVADINDLYVDDGSLDTPEVAAQLAAMKPPPTADLPTGT